MQRCSNRTGMLIKNKGKLAKNRQKNGGETPHSATWKVFGKSTTNTSALLLHPWFIVDINLMLNQRFAKLVRTDAPAEQTIKN